jgi:hypothetical protein
MSLINYLCHDLKFELGHFEHKQKYQVVMKDLLRHTHNIFSALNDDDHPFNMLFGDWHICVAPSDTFEFMWGLDFSDHHIFIPETGEFVNARQGPTCIGKAKKKGKVLKVERLEELRKQVFTLTGDGELNYHFSSYISNFEKSM